MLWSFFSLCRTIFSQMKEYSYIRKMNIKYKRYKMSIFFNNTCLKEQVLLKYIDLKFTIHLTYSLLFFSLHFTWLFNQHYQCCLRTVRWNILPSSLIKLTSFWKWNHSFWSIENCPILFFWEIFPKTLKSFQTSVFLHGNKADMLFKLYFAFLFCFLFLPQRNKSMNWSAAGLSGILSSRK